MNTWPDTFETICRIAAKARKDQAFQSELSAVIEKYMPELFPTSPENKASLGSPSLQSEGAAAKKAVQSDGAKNAPVLNPFEFTVEEEDSLKDRLMGLEIPQLRDIIRAYDLDPFRQTTRWKTKSRIVDKMMEVLHQRLINGAALRRN